MPDRSLTHWVHLSARHGRHTRWGIGLLAAVVAAVAFAATGARAASTATLSLVDHGKSDYKIFVANRAPEVDGDAAAELQRLIQESSGVKLPIVSGANVHDHLIVIGNNALAGQAGVVGKTLPRDSFHIRVVGTNLYLVGRDDKGNFYRINNNRTVSGGSYFAMVWFARHQMGVHWYMPGPLGVHVPKHVTLSIPANLNVTQKPRYVIRAIGGTGTKTAKYMAGLRKRGVWKHDYFSERAAHQSSVWGRHLMLGNDVNLSVSHAWYKWVPADHPNRWSPKAYGKTHPEYFALWHGKRQNFYVGSYHGGQLCVSNPEVIKTYADNVIAFAKKTGWRSFSMSPNDGGRQGDGPNSTKWDLPPGGRGKPRLINRLIRFANAVAQRVVKQVPDAHFGLYAYAGSRHPPSPGIALDPSVTISDVYNFLPYQYDSGGKIRKALQTDIVGWRERVPKVLLTSYYTGYGHWSLPWSTPNVLAWLNKDLRRYKSSIGMRISYAENSYPMMGAVGPDPWIAGHLMWNPDQSVSVLEKRFYNGAFGPQAGPLIEKFYHTINQSMIRTVRANPYHSTHTVQQYIVPAYSAVRAQCHALIEQAVADVRSLSAGYRWRVDRVARAWRLAELTLDAINAEKQAKLTSGNLHQQMVERALTLARKRMQLVRDPASRFAISPRVVEEMDNNMPLGIARTDTNAAAMKHATITIPATTRTINIDGKLTDGAWRHAATVRLVSNNRSGKVPSTKAKLLCSGQGLYVAFQSAERDMGKAVIVDAPRSLWDGDVVELFIQRGRGANAYLLHFSVNPHGVGKALRQQNNGVTDWSFKPRWRYAASIGPHGWQVEMFIPWKALGANKAPWGQTWAADVFREHPKSPQPYIAWVPTYGPFASSMTYGSIRFPKRP